MNRIVIPILVIAMLASTPIAHAQTKPAVAGGGDSLPTMDELKGLMDQQQWQQLLQRSSRVVSLRGQAAQNYDRYDLLMMRGEAQLQMKNSPQAIASFKDAIDESKD